MPKFFLDLYDGEHFTRDPYGLDLESSEEARKEAIGVLPDLARDVLPDGDRRDFTVDVRTAVGEVIYTATLSLVGRWLKGLDIKMRETGFTDDVTVPAKGAAANSDRLDGAS